MKKKNRGCNPGKTWDSGCGTDSGNNLPDADPLFINPISAASAPTTAGDYRLLSGSPAIDAGDDNFITTATDLDGNPRISGAAVDLGAYEFQLNKISLPLILKVSP